MDIDPIETVNTAAEEAERQGAERAANARLSTLVAVTRAIGLKLTVEAA